MDPVIVVIEDDEDILNLLRDVLEMDGYHVVGMCRPENLESVHSLKLSLVVLDLMLPGISGVELARGLRKTICTKTPIIGTSASPLMMDVAHESGVFDAIVEKPLDLSVLRQYVQVLTGTAPASA